MNNCQFCNKETPNAKFCSRSCAGLGGKRMTKQYRGKSCLECGVEFNAVGARKKEKVFCSHSCAATFNNKKFPKRTSPVDRLELCSRPTCGKSLYGRAVRKYCSSACMGQHAREQFIQAWLDDPINNGSDGHGLSKPILAYVKEQAGWRCQSPTCAYPGGWSEINPSTGRIPVQVDHIDGDAYNNKPENLIVLCPSCHSLTPTFGSLNKNGTRQYRYKNAPLAQ